MSVTESYEFTGADAPASLDDKWRPFRAIRLYSLSYRSRAREIPTESGMNKLLAQARERNRSLGVAGMLQYKNGYFHQWLEGPSKGVAEIWRSIRNDPRHGEIELLSEGVAAARVFGKWDMLWSPRGDRLASEPPRQDERSQDASRLAQLAIAGNAAAVEAWVAGLIGPDEDVKSLYRGLFEPTARLLGDWWREDRCADLDVTLALAALQTVARRLAAPPLGKSKLIVRSVLLAPQPGEPHLLGAFMAGDFFREARWNAAIEFPKTDAELSDLVRERWFDALNLSLSDVFTREHRLPSLAALIGRLREASRNPRLAIVVGGRAFTPDWRLAAAAVGADIGYSTCADVVDQTGVALLRRLAPGAEGSLRRDSLVGTPPAMTLCANPPLGWQAIPEPAFAEERERVHRDAPERNEWPRH